MADERLVMLKQRAVAGLIDVGGTLYGTTNFGGTHDCGTVFKLIP
jgi:uncharacterized repeat protein (TIGR03803 family)